jgi:hypothetical protein
MRTEHAHELELTRRARDQTEHGAATSGSTSSSDANPQPRTRSRYSPRPRAMIVAMSNERHRSAGPLPDVLSAAGRRGARRCSSRWASSHRAARRPVLEDQPAASDVWRPSEDGPRSYRFAGRVWTWSDVVPRMCAAELSWLTAAHAQTVPVDRGDALENGDSRRATWPPARGSRAWWPH